MSLQIFLQGKLLGIEDFVLAPAADGEPGGQALLAGRSHWVALLAEVLPRAVLAELGLARILLGTSGGGGFLIVIPAEFREQASGILASASNQILEMSGGRLRLVWAATENLGDWSIVRKRLSDELFRKQGTIPGVAELLASGANGADGAVDDSYFTTYLTALAQATSAGWSPDQPGKVTLGEGTHTWPIGSSPDQIPLARHHATEEDSTAPAELATLAKRAEGRPVWGVLRGDVDNFGVRLRRMVSIEEHILHSVLFKQFFAGELEAACFRLPDLAHKVTILYSGGDDFAVAGAWDALLMLAREMQRMFQRFAEEDLKEAPGLEGKTITMSLALAPAEDTPFAFVYEEASRSLAVAKAADKDCLHIFGKPVDWKQLNQAGDMKDTLLQLIREHGANPQVLGELSGIYRDKPPARDGGRTRQDRPWRYHRRLGMLLGSGRNRDFQRIRNGLIADVIGRSPVQVRLRPAGRVAVEWARLLIEA
jgi:CRISPR-associated protein Csm1